MPGPSIPALFGPGAHENGGRPDAPPLQQARRLPRRLRFVNRTAPAKAAPDVPPEYALGCVRRSAALRQEGRIDAALSELRKALVVAPSFAEAHHQAGNILKSQGRFVEAAAALRKAAELAPRDSVVLLNLGVALLELESFEEAVACFSTSVAIEPRRAEAFNILGHALLCTGRCTEAIAALETALRLRPGYAAPLDNLGRALKAQGRSAEAISRHRQALAASPEATTHSNLLYSLQLVNADPETVLEEHLRWARLYGAGERARDLPQPDLSGRRMRVGYVSPDFVNHAVSYFFAPVLACHDRSRVEVFCYSNSKVTDSVTDRLRGLSEHWRNIAGVGDAAVEALIRRDGIDILVDLAGHTAGNRLRVFARRPAPVQVTWLGYPGTTGLEAVDYRITDALSDPHPGADAAYVEKLVRIEGTFSCYEPCANSPDVGPLPALEAGAVTFGCFNNFAKVTPEMIVLWAGVLIENPGSRLVLKSKGFLDPRTCDRVASQFLQAGVQPSRLTFDGKSRSAAEHLALYGGIDVALDTFPYNGATTTCEALWMGVPVVSLSGRTHASRVGASFLTQVGLGDCVVTTPEDYRAACRALVRDLPSLAGLRATLRERMRGSSLCDASAFVRRLENAYAAMVAPRG